MQFDSATLLLPSHSVTHEALRHRSISLSQESTRSSDVSISMTKNKMLKVLQTLADKKKFVNYGQKFFEEDCVVSGRDLPSYATFSIQLQSFHSGPYSRFSSPRCIIFYHKDPTFQFEKKKTKMFITYAQLKHSVVKVLQNHGMKIIKWKPSYMHDRLAAAYALNSACYNMSLTEIMNMPMPVRLEELMNVPMPIRLEGAVPQGITQLFNRDRSGHML
jgi:hypothetical protein